MSWWKTRMSLGSTSKPAERQLIINGDDFGLAPAVNSGIVLAYREGTLRSASLMVGQPAAWEAVEMARQNPGLAVGLHVALSDARPVLPPEQIPDLVQPDGRFHPDESRLKVQLLFSQSVRRQVRAEIAAQFAAFRGTGLLCDHVNTHRNIHLHPVIALLLFQAAAREGVPTLRIPWQPSRGQIVWHQRSSPWLNAIRLLRVIALRGLARLYGLQTPARAIDVTGRGASLPPFLAKLPAGTTELYLHPATARGFAGSAPGLPYLEDLATLCDPHVRHAVAETSIGGYRAALLRHKEWVGSRRLAVAPRGH